MHTKIMIIGSPGSGKSTFARKLRDKTGLPLFYLDMIKHKPDRTTISSEKFDKKLKEILVKSQWIIDGNYQRTLEVRMKECDLIILFDLPIKVCLESVKSRIGTKEKICLGWKLRKHLRENSNNGFRNFQMKVSLKYISFLKNTKIKKL